MNDLARDTLRQAALSGVKQITGRLRDKAGGLCALAVLGFYDYCLVGPLERLYGMSKDPVWCPICDNAGEPRSGEWSLISHLNDRHGCDFLKIAELMPRNEDAT